MEDNQGFHTVRGYQILGQEKNTITSAMEDYLEMIYRDSLRTGYARVNTISVLLNVKASSATKMVQKLAAEGLVQYEKYEIILLTDKGKEIGEFLLKRHMIIETFLKNIGVEDNLLIETELIEHNISKDTLEKVEMFNMYLEIRQEIKDDFKDYVRKHT